MLETVGSGKSRAMESARGDKGVPELQTLVGDIESQLAHITQLLAGMSGFFGVTHSQGSSPTDNAQDTLSPMAGVSSHSGVSMTVDTRHPFADARVPRVASTVSTARVTPSSIGRVVFMRAVLLGRDSTCRDKRVWWTPRDCSASPWKC